LRKKLPCLANCQKDLTEVSFDEEEKWLQIQRRDPKDATCALLIANLSAVDRVLPLPPGEWKLLISSSGEGSQPLVKGWTAQMYAGVNQGRFLNRESGP